MIRKTLTALGFAVVSFAAREARAAPRWVDRPLTLPRHDWSFDVGLGAGRNSAPATVPPQPPPNGGPLPTTTNFGPGMNVEAAVAVVHHLELGLRFGFRFGDQARAANADYYARTLFTETWGTRGDAVVNPELKVRWALYSGDVFEIGLDGRVFLPIESRSLIGVMPGLPVAFHIADVVRIDSGVFVPITAFDPGGDVTSNTSKALSIPLHLWIQASNRFWVGPMSSLRFVDPGVGDPSTQLVLGFGGGYQALSWLDLKAMFLFPRITETEGARAFGFGFGAQFRIE